MRYHGLSGGEIVAQVFSQFEPRTVWGGDVAIDVRLHENARLYCPGCHQHNTIFLRDEKHAENGVKKPWFCRSCKEWHRRPKKLTRKGEISSTQTRPVKKHYALLDFEAITVLRVIDQMNPLLRAWTLWVHTEKASLTLQPKIVNEAINIVDAADYKPQSYSEGVRLYFFAEQLAENERQLMRTSRPKYSVEHFATGLGVGTRQLQAGKKWGAIRELIQRRYRELESEMETIIVGALDSVQYREVANAN